MHRMREVPLKGRNELLKQRAEIDAELGSISQALASKAA